MAQPITLIALAVLVVNDHVLKAAFPGLVTGKLSDVAGLLVAAPLLATAVSLVWRRLPVDRVAAGSIAVVGLGFALAKAIPGGSAVASATWSLLRPNSHILADVTDLVALPVLAVAWYAWRRARLRPMASRAARLARVCVVLPVMTVAVAATSQVYAPIAVDVVQDRGEILLGRASVSPNWQAEDLADVVGVTSSADGVAWTPAGSTGRSAAFDDHVPVRVACRAVGSTDCYRLVPGKLAIEEGNDRDGWVTAWGLSNRERATLLDYYDPFTADLLECRSILVFETAYGPVVVAACGRDGFVTRDVDGVWTRIGFPPHSPAVDIAALGGPTPIPVVPLFIALVAAWLAMLLGTELVRPGGRYRIAARVLAIISAAAWWPSYTMLTDLFIGTLTLALVLPVQFGLGVAWVVLHASQSTFRVAVAAAAVATGLIAGLPTYLAQQGVIPPADWYFAADGVLAVVGIVATALVGRRSTPRAKPVEEPVATPPAEPAGVATSVEGGDGEVGERG